MSRFRTLTLCFALTVSALCAQVARAQWVYISTDWRIYIGHPIIGPWEATTYVDEGLFTMSDTINFAAVGDGDGSFDPFHAGGVAFFDAGHLAIPDGMVQITTVYGMDTTPEGPRPTLAGFDPAEPQLVPISLETIIAGNGNQYQSDEGVTVPVAFIGDLLPGHDLASWFDFSDPFSIVYVFRTLAPFAEFYNPPCPGDFNDDGLLDLVDISGFIGAFLAGDPAADFDANRVFDLTDLSVFIQSFQTGCP